MAVFLYLLFETLPRPINSAVVRVTVIEPIVLLIQFWKTELEMISFDLLIAKAYIMGMIQVRDLNVTERNCICDLIN